LKRIARTLELRRYPADAVQALIDKGIDLTALLAAMVVLKAAEQWVALASLQKMIPEQEDYTEEAFEIVYEYGDRVALGRGQGLVGARFIRTEPQESGKGHFYLDTDPETLVVLPMAQIVKQADTGEVGPIAYVKEIREGWIKVPNVALELNPGDSLRGCPRCQNVVTQEEEEAGACSDCGQSLAVVVKVELVQIADTLPQFFMDRLRPGKELVGATVDNLSNLGVGDLAVKGSK
jgi:hypothetical protein